MNIYISNLNFATKDESLRNLFAGYGDVSSANIITDRETGRSRGFGFVEMPDETQGRSAIDERDRIRRQGHHGQRGPSENGAERPGRIRQQRRLRQKTVLIRPVLRIFERYVFHRRTYRFWYCFCLVSVGAHGKSVRCRFGGDRCPKRENRGSVFSSSRTDYFLRMKATSPSLNFSE